MLFRSRKMSCVRCMARVHLCSKCIVPSIDIKKSHAFSSQVLKYCQRTWLLNVCDFLVSIEGTIHLEHKWNLAIQRTHDIFLMDAIMNHIPHFPPKVLKQMNACRIFLQVLSLADISDGSGREILKSSLQGIWHNDRRSSYDWPKQLRPSAGAWRTWQSTLQALFCVNPKSTRLRQQIGRAHV